MRLAAYLRSMAEWRWSRCRHAIRCLDVMLSGRLLLLEPAHRSNAVLTHTVAHPVTHPITHPVTHPVTRPATQYLSHLLTHTSIHLQTNP